MEEQRVPTTEKLAQVLSLTGAPKEMIEMAQSGRYDDFKSEVDFPQMTLVNEARLAHLPPEFIQRVIGGEFDAQEWEADEWEKSEDGRETFKKFMSNLKPVKNRKKRR
jgi:hypothetical protein